MKSAYNNTCLDCNFYHAINSLHCALMRFFLEILDWFISYKYGQRQNFVRVVHRMKYQMTFLMNADLFLQICLQIWKEMVRTYVHVNNIIVINILIVGYFFDLFSINCKRFIITTAIEVSAPCTHTFLFSESQLCI